MQYYFRLLRNVTGSFTGYFIKSMSVLIELLHRTHSVRLGVSDKSVAMGQLIAKAVQGEQGGQDTKGPFLWDQTAPPPHLTSCQ